jgi:hypothetical protein
MGWIVSRGPSERPLAGISDASPSGAGALDVALSAPRLEMRMPDRILEGDFLNIALSSDRHLLVAVVYLEESGNGALLLPTPIVPEPVVSPGHDRKLPPIQPTLRYHGRAANERLIAYGFMDSADFQRVRSTPFRGTTSQYVEDLDAALAASPRDRWVRQEIHYVIQPR